MKSLKNRFPQSDDLCKLLVVVADIPVAAHAEILPDKVIFRALSYKPEYNELKKIKQETTLENVWDVAENVAKQMLDVKIE